MHPIRHYSPKRVLRCKSGHEPVGGSAEAFQKLVGEDFQKNEHLTKALNIATP
jgi:hypothetical protein